MTFPALMVSAVKADYFKKTRKLTRRSRQLIGAMPRIFMESSKAWIDP